MPNPVVAVTAGASIVGGYMSSKAQKDAAAQAAGAQTEAAQLGIEESRRQFDRMQEILQPYTQAGTQAIGRQGAIAGLQGPEAQERFIREIEQSPAFEAVVEQGEQAILQRASATGGIRGGNVQGALAQFRPAMLNQFIDREFQRLSELGRIGQASAAGVGAAGIQTGQDIAGQFTQIGSAQAGEAVARGQANVNLYGDIATGTGTVAGAWPSSTPPDQPPPLTPEQRRIVMETGSMF
ncbi:hypothetical protein KAR91_21350 [Candidatus Pacearchaeota archaeon]|nr:hypothetical protein [Candidatus Pacearchaeota archaeon]